MATTYYPTYKQAYDLYASTGGGGTPTPAKPKKLVFAGDSLVNSVLSTTSRAVTRLNSSALATAIVSFPGEGARDMLTSHMPALADAIDATKDCYLIISEDTNGLNQYYIDQVKADALELATAVLGQGYKGIVWMQVAACQSPYAYARDAQGNIIGTSTAERQAGFDNARLAYNAYLQTLVGTKIYRVGDLSVYPNIYTQANASDTRYFYAAGTGPYGSGEPGKVHYTDYGARYWAEAAAQAAAPMLGITLSPATISIPDAPAGTTYLPSPQQPLYDIASPNAAYVNGYATKVASNTSWDTNLRALVAINRLPDTETAIVEWDEPRTGHEGVLFGVTVTPMPTTGFGFLDTAFYYDSSDFRLYESGNPASDTLTRRSGKPRIEITNTSLKYFIGTDPNPVRSVPGNTRYPLYVAASLGLVSGPAGGPSEVPPVKITASTLTAIAP